MRQEAGRAPQRPGQGPMGAGSGSTPRLGACLAGGVGGLGRGTDPGARRSSASPATWGDAGHRDGQHRPTSQHAEPVTFHGDETTPHVVLCDWLFKLSRVFLRLIQLAA